MRWCRERPACPSIRSSSFTASATIGVSSATLQSILAGSLPSVVAAAGGVVNEPSTWKALLDRTTVVWLRARPEDHWRRVVAQGDRRPMADNPDAMAELRAMLASREARYAQAHLVVDTARRTPEAVAKAIASELASRNERSA